MLLGHVRHQVDSKGRVAVPAQYRRSLPEGSVVSIGNEGRIVIRPPAEWDEVRHQYSMSAQTAEEERRLTRMLFSSARVLELDGQGRMLLDAEHRRWAQIGDRAVFVGIGSLVEIVGEEVFDAERAALNPTTFTELNDRVIKRSGAAPAGAPTTSQ